MICKRFLWSGSAEIKRKSLIAWDKVCTPKVAGVLNMLNVHLWNKAAICKLLWDICQKEKLSVVWVHTYYIKQGDAWSTKSASWTIRIIFKAKQYLVDAEITMQEFIDMHKFSIKKICQVLQGVYPKVGWGKLICNNQGRPGGISFSG